MLIPTNGNSRTRVQTAQSSEKTIWKQSQAHLYPNQAMQQTSK
jgi:hypothetical protein